MEKYGDYEIYGYDEADAVINDIKNKHVKYWEAQVNDLLVDSKIQVCDSIDELVQKCELIFVAVQTPHDPLFEGRTPLPSERKDFNYAHIVSVANSLADSLSKLPESNPTIVVISTVLPGTMKNHILPVLKKVRKEIKFAYNPYFIAMGTTVFDFLNPEFILLGANLDEVQREIIEFYSFLNAEVSCMDIESAELTKVAYNTFIGFKIVFANTIAEITEKRGGNPDQITLALSKANRRLMSPAYMQPGMGDGGGCHPRDQIAMSWLAKELDLSVDIFEFLADARDKQTMRFANLILEIAENSKLPIAILGLSYKANSPLDIGSPARLLENMLESKGASLKALDPWIKPDDYSIPREPHVFFIGVMHSEFRRLDLPQGSILIDPWGYVEHAGNQVQILTPGRHQRKV
jgi:UDPglucose 6-dehydrogenase